MYDAYDAQSGMQVATLCHAMSSWPKMQTKCVTKATAKHISDLRQLGQLSADPFIKCRSHPTPRRLSHIFNMPVEQNDNTIVLKHSNVSIFAAEL